MEMLTSPDDVNTTTSDVAVDLNDSYGNYYDYDYDYDAGEMRFYYVLWTIATPIVFALITVVGVIGNLIVVMVIVTRRSRRQSPTNILLLNLAVADLAFLVVCVPFTAVKYAASSWPLGETACRVVNYLLYVTVYVTVYTLVAVSVLRYIVVVCSTSRLAGVVHRARPAAVTSAVIWALSLVGNGPTYGAFTVKSIGADVAGSYEYCGVEDDALSVTVLAFFVVGYALPLTAISALYVLIACHVRRHRRLVAGRPRGGPQSVSRAGRAAAAGHRNARTLRLIVVVVVVFGVSWLPIHLQSLAGYFGLHSPRGAVYEVFRIVWNCMAYSNSCANPFIYHCRPSAGPRRDRLARRRQPARRGPDLSLCCQSASSFTSTVGRDRALPRSQRTRITCLRPTTSFRRTTYRNMRVVASPQPLDTRL